MKSTITDSIKTLFDPLGLQPQTSDYLGRFTLIVLVIFLSWLCYFICKKFLITGIGRIVRKTKTTWDDRIFTEKLLRDFSHLAPAIVLFLLLPVALPDRSEILTIADKLCRVYIIAVSLRFVNTLLAVFFEAISTHSAFRGRSLKGFLQVVQILVIFIGIILIISTIIDQSPAKLFAGLGASAAILTLVFKDSLVGLIAGVQLTVNDMVRTGDWIELPKYGIDGNVIDITLNTVKVRNWDNTILTIPPSTLMSDAFKNWRGMSESGGRRIKRSINIDMNSIRFCSEEMLEKYRKIEYIKGYLDRKEKEIQKYNSLHNVDQSVIVNGRRQTNIGIFRAYIEMYLRNNAYVNQNLTCMVRQLQPTEQGLPLELYFFSAEKRWIQYESFQSDVFDHLLAILPEFDLRIFQNPTGGDFQRLK